LAASDFATGAGAAAGAGFAAKEMLPMAKTAAVISEVIRVRDVVFITPPHSCDYYAHLM
jgi:hypothetical protein